MEQILFSLLEQSPVIIFVTIFLGVPIVLSVVIVFMYKKLNKVEKSAIAERKAHKKEIKELNEAHALAIKVQTDYIRESDLENMKVLEAIKAHMIKNNNNGNK